MKNSPLLLTVLTTSSLLVANCNNSETTNKTPAQSAAETPKTAAMEMETKTTTPDAGAVAQNLLNMQAAYKGEMTATAKYATPS